jgi:hypothetical protein
MSIEQREDKEYLKYEKQALAKALELTGKEDFQAAFEAVKKVEKDGIIKTQLKGYYVVDSLRELVRLGKIAERKGMNYEKLGEAYAAGEHTVPEKGKVSYYDQVTSTFCGGFEQYWIGPYRWQRETGKESDGSEDHLVDIAETVSDNCGYMLIYDEAVIFSKKPKKIDMDLDKYWEDGTVTCTSGPLLEFEDGDSYYMTDNEVKSEEEFNKERLKRESKLLKVLGDI